MNDNNQHINSCKSGLITKTLNFGIAGILINNIYKVVSDDGRMDAVF